MVRAASRGVVDFSKARLFDPLWIRQMHWRLETMQQDDEFKLRTAIHHHHVSLMTIVRITDESYEHSRTLSGAQINRMQELTYPWLDFSTQNQEDTKSEYRKAIRSWSSRFGDLKDPEVQAAAQELAAALRQRKEQAREESKPAFVPVKHGSKSKRRRRR